MLIDYDLLLFREKNIISKELDTKFAYFEIDQKKLESNPILSSCIKDPEENYCAHDIDDLLLGPLDDIGTFHKKKLMDIDIARSFFRYYIMRLCKNQQIDNYLKWHKKQPDAANAYEGLSYIYNIFKDEEREEKKDEKQEEKADSSLRSE